MNSVNLIGRATRDPEMRYFESGKKKTEVGMAVQRTKDEADFFEIQAWEKAAEILAEYVRKGQQFAIEGRLQQEQWEAQDGSKRSKIVVVAQRIELLAGGDNAGRKKDEAAAKELGGKVVDGVPF